MEVANGKQVNMSPDDLHRLCEGPKIQLINWLQSLGLLANAYLCPRCKNRSMRLVSNSCCSDGFRWQCCNIHRPIRGGTVFENRHLTIQQMLMLTYNWCMRAPQHYARTVLKRKSKNTIVRWYQFCREICMKYIMEREEKIGGPGTIVDIDESLFGGKGKYNRGRNPQWVLRGIERGSNKCFLVPVENRDHGTFQRIILDHVLPGTTIYTDCWRAYNHLTSIGFKCYSVNHSTTGNTNKGAWSCMKRTLVKAGRRAEYLPHYFAEFMWRKQFATEGDPFLIFLDTLAHMFPPLSADVYSLEPEENDTEKCHFPLSPVHINGSTLPPPDDAEKCHFPLSPDHINGSTLPPPEDAEKCHFPLSPDHTYARPFQPPGIPLPDHTCASPVPYVMVDHDYL